MFDAFDELRARQDIRQVRQQIREADEESVNNGAKLDEIIESLNRIEDKLDRLNSKLR